MDKRDDERLRKENRAERKRDREAFRTSIKKIEEKLKNGESMSLFSEIVHVKLNIKNFIAIRKVAGMSANWFALMMRISDVEYGIEPKSRWTFKLQRQLESGEMKYISVSLQERLINCIGETKMLGGEEFFCFMSNWIFIIEDAISND